MLFASVFTIVSIGVFLVLYFMLSNELDRRLQSEIDETHDTILETQRAEAPEALSKVVDRYAAFDRKTDDIFLLTDANGTYLAGNIKPIPYFTGWKRIEWNQLHILGPAKPIDPDTAVVAKWTKVDNGLLLVGDGDGDIVEAREILMASLAGGTLLTILLATLGATLLGTIAQRRVRAMEIALEAVALGSLDARVPRYPAGDDFDKVGARINLTLERLQDLIGAVRQVTTDVAHDLRTPIGHIRQRLEAALNAPTETQDHQATIQSAILGLDSVTETFDSLLRIAEIEAGARKSRFADLDLSSLIASVSESYEPVALDAGHTLVQSSGHPATVSIHGDEKLLTQLFVNIIENAIRHCPPGSKICVEVASVASKPTVTISDNGPGIPEAQREFVFRRLYRLEKSRTTPGNGLGLSLVSAIVGLHDAEIELSDNKPGLAVKICFPDRAMAVQA